MINSLRSDMSEAKELIKAFDESIAFYNELIDEKISQYGFTLRLRDVLSRMTLEEVNALDSAKVDKIIAFTQSKLSDINKAKDNGSDEEKAKTFSQYVIDTFKDIYDCIVKHQDGVKERANLDEELRKVTNTSYDASVSKKNRMDRVEALEKQVENETDPEKKKSIQKMLDTVRKAEDLSFLTARIEKIGDNEVRNIINTFFNNKRSSLIMDKFRIRIKRLGYDENTYKMFFNIEEMFLPEEYYPMNNIFLFNAMRYISYADTNNKGDALFCSSLLIKMYNLVYHRFSTPEEEASFIEFVKHVDDFFMPHVETLKEKNITSPVHPARIEAKTENEARLRESLCNAIIAHGKTLDDDVVKMSVKELKEYLEKIVAEEKDASEKALTDFIASDLKVEEPEVKEETVEETEDTPTEEVVDEVVETPEESSDVEDLDVDEIWDSDKQELKADAEEISTDDDNSMVIDRRPDATVITTAAVTERNLEGVEVYVDSYGDMYVLSEDKKTYDFFDSRDGHRAEAGVDPVTVLQLGSCGAATKKSFVSGYITPDGATIYNYKVSE